MAGSSFQFNHVKGKIRTYCELSAANDAVIVVPIENTSIEGDTTLKDYDDLASLLAGSSNEQTTIGRKTITSFTITEDDTNDWVKITIGSSVAWTAPTGNAVGKLLFCYDPDTTTGTDSTLVPMLAYAVTWTPDGNDFTVNAHTDGLIRVT